jgi:voltage-gated potassium channel
MIKSPKKNTPDNSYREELLHRVERYTELPLLILAFAMIPLLVGPWLWTLNPQEASTFHALDLLIWALFAIDLIIKVAIAPRRLQYLRRHWLEVLVVVFPLIRPLRILRVFIFGSRAWVGMRRLVNVDFLLVYGIGLVIIAATIVATVERGPLATIHSFADALWWSVVTITTVGYGDMVPVTWGGRAVAVVLMLGGIAFFSGVTANLASFLIKRKDKEKENTEMTQLIKEVKGLKEEIARLRPGSAS